MDRFGNVRERRQRVADRHGHGDRHASTRRTARPRGGRDGADEPDGAAVPFLRAGDDVHGDAVGAADELVRQRAAQQLRDEPAARAPEHDLRDVLEAGEAQELRGDVARRERPRLRAERLRRASVPRRRCRRACIGGWSPGFSTVTAIHGASMRSASRFAARTISAASASGPMQARMRSPAAHGPSMRLRLHALDEVGVDALGGAAQGELAQRRQVLRLEETFARARRHVAHIDLALGEALEQLLGRQVDQHDLVGFLEHAVGHRLAHPHARDLLEDVVEALRGAGC